MWTKDDAHPHPDQIEFTALVAAPKPGAKVLVHCGEAGWVEATAKGVSQLPAECTDTFDLEKMRHTYRDVRNKDGTRLTDEQLHAEFTRGVLMRWLSVDLPWEGGVGSFSSFRHIPTEAS